MTIAALTADLARKQARLAELRADGDSIADQVVREREAAAASLIDSKSTTSRKIAELEARGEATADAIKLLGFQIEQVERQLLEARAAESKAGRMAQTAAAADIINEVLPVLSEALGRVAKADTPLSIGLSIEISQAFALAANATDPCAEFCSRLLQISQRLRSSLQTARSLEAADVLAEPPPCDTPVHIVRPVSVGLRAWRGDRLQFDEDAITLVPKVVAEAIVKVEAGSILEPPSETEVRMVRDVVEDGRQLSRGAVLTFERSSAMELIVKGAANATGRLPEGVLQYYRAKLPAAGSAFGAIRRTMKAMLDLGVIDAAGADVATSA